jgi:hypothetical protein
VDWINEMGNGEKDFRILFFKMEAATGLEPVNNGFADRCLSHLAMPPFPGVKNKLERETGFEPATSTLARLHSTTELFPLKRIL